LFIESLSSQETRNFVERVMANVWIYQQRLQQATPSLDNVAAGAWPIYQPQDDLATASGGSRRLQAAHGAHSRQPAPPPPPDPPAPPVAASRPGATHPPGAPLAELTARDGHKLVDRGIVKDEIAAITARLKAWIADPRVEVVISTGGTGVTGRDVTTEAFEAVFEKRIDGFGAMFRHLNLPKIGTSTLPNT